MCVSETLQGTGSVWSDYVSFGSGGDWLLRSAVHGLRAGCGEWHLMSVYMRVCGSDLFFYKLQLVDQKWEMESVKCETATQHQSEQHDFLFLSTQTNNKLFVLFPLPPSHCLPQSSHAVFCSLVLHIFLCFQQWLDAAKPIKKQIRCELSHTHTHTLTQVVIVELFSRLVTDGRWPWAHNLLLP